VSATTTTTPVPAAKRTWILGIHKSDAATPQATLREDSVTMVLAFYTLIALYWDGINHNNHASIDTFWTAAHIAMYIGLTVIGGWIAFVILRRQNPRSLDFALIPHGYGLAVVALPLAAIGGPADFLWHKFYGFENQTDAPYSPTHQTLFLAGTLLGAIAIRSAWHRPGIAPGIRAMVLPIASMTVVVAIVMFVFMHLNPFFTGFAPTSDFQNDISRFNDAFAPGTNVHHAQGLAESIAHYGDNKFPYYFFSTEATVGAIMLTTIVLVGALLYMRRRWELPFGAITCMWTALALLFAMLTQYRRADLIGVLAIAGLVGDVLLHYLAPHGRPRRWAIRTFAAVMPIVLWGLFLLFIELFEGGLGWGPSLWVGILSTSAGVGFGVGLMTYPEPVTDEMLAAPSG
jgi:hypothetical protein